MDINAKIILLGCKNQRGMILLAQQEILLIAP
jgi:hypothetical protein